MLIVCSLCREHKTRSSFYSLAKRESGIDWYCRDCRKRASREHRRNHVEVARARYLDWYKKNKQHRALTNKKYCLMRNYGLSFDEYIALAEKQGDKCAICGRTPEGKKVLGLTIATKLALFAAYCVTDVTCL